MLENIAAHRGRTAVLVSGDGEALTSLGDYLRIEEITEPGTPDADRLFWAESQFIGGLIMRNYTVLDGRGNPLMYFEWEYNQDRPGYDPFAKRLIAGDGLPDARGECAADIRLESDSRDTGRHCGIVSLDGAYVAQPVYSDIEPNGEGGFQVTDDDDRAGLIDQDGEIVLEPADWHVMPLSLDRFWVEKPEGERIRYGMIDREGPLAVRGARGSVFVSDGLTDGTDGWRGWRRSDGPPARRRMLEIPDYSAQMD